MLLAELFNTKPADELEQLGGIGLSRSGFVSEFEDDGITYKVLIMNDKNHLCATVYKLAKVEADKDSYFISFLGNHSDKLLNKNRSIQVFSRIAGILKKFAQDHKPSTIIYGYNKAESNREPLYKKFVKYFEREGFKLDKEVDVAITAKLAAPIKTRCYVLKKADHES